MQLKIENFISQLTLINYPPGHMGTFFENLLYTDEYFYKKMSEIGIFRKRENKEWESIEYNHLMFTKEEYANFVSSMGLDSLLEFTPTNFKILLFKIHGVLNKKIYQHVNTSVFMPSFKLWQSLTKEDFQNACDDETNILLPYLKSHIKYSNTEDNYQFDNLYLNGIGFKQKIHCCFPKTKQWIPNILVLDKHVLYNFINPSQYAVKVAKTFLEGSPLADNDKLKNTFDYNLPGFHTVDMYDLIINKNINQAACVNDFKITEAKKQRLSEVNNDVIKTLQSYDLDPDMDIDLDTEFDKFRYCSEKIINKLR